MLLLPDTQALVTQGPCATPFGGEPLLARDTQFPYSEGHQVAPQSGHDNQTRSMVRG